MVVHGRIGDVIVTGGEKVWPDAVEAVLRDVPGVDDVAVAGVADAEWGAARRRLRRRRRRRAVARRAPRRGQGRAAARSCAPKQLVLVDAAAPHRARQGAAARGYPARPSDAPPSMTNVWPVIHDAASDARNSAAPAMSSGSPSRRSGIVLAIASSLRSHRARAKSVFTRPGASALTRIFGASSAASCLVRLMSAALVLL